MHCGLAAEAREVDDEEGGDVVRPLAERALPVAGLPEAEAARGLVGVARAEGGHGHGGAWWGWGLGLGLGLGLGFRLRLRLRVSA